MISFKTICAGAIAIACLAYAPSAAAQATRTWVSGVGDDVNPCSRTAPCKTFAGAISKTAAGGEIDCLDPGGYGTVTITKSITIDCTGTFGSILNSSTNGVNVNDSATGTPGTIEVILRGLSLNGAGTTPGLQGIRFTSGASLVIENAIIQNDGTSPAYAVSFQPSAAAKLSLNNVVITGNGAGTNGGGVLVQPTGANGSARVDIRNTNITLNAGQAVRVDTTGNTGTGNRVTIANSALSGNVLGLVVVTPASTTTAVVSVFDSTISNNANTGILANGGTAQVRVSGSKITGNGAGGAGQGGLFVGGGANIVSYGDNVLFGNAPDGSFTATLPKN